MDRIGLEDKTEGQEIGQACRTYYMDRKRLLDMRQDRPAGLPKWTGQDWRKRPQDRR